MWLVLGCFLVDIAWDVDTGRLEKNEGTNMGVVLREKRARARLATFPRLPRRLRHEHQAPVRAPRAAGGPGDATTSATREGPSCTHHGITSNSGSLLVQLECAQIFVVYSTQRPSKPKDCCRRAKFRYHAHTQDTEHVGHAPQTRPNQVQVLTNLMHTASKPHPGTCTPELLVHKRPSPRLPGPLEPVPTLVLTLETCVSKADSVLTCAWQRWTERRLRRGPPLTST